jgi:4-hydroxybenzoate polyprenyltransferase
VLNDLLDVEADRAHPTKRNRPFASGALPTTFGPPMFVLLLVGSFGLSWWALPRGFLAMLVVYFVGTTSYSAYFKRLLLVDVFVLASLYTLRILAGGVATAVPISAWLLAFSIFLFLSLALAKRYVEIRALEGDGRIKNRNYEHRDLHVVSSLGASSGYLASLVFTLYVELGTHTNVYPRPGVLWLAAGVLLYWVSRIWVLAGRGQMQDDPVKFALTDRVSIFCGLAFAGAMALARFWPPWLDAIFAGLGLGIA